MGFDIECIVDIHTYPGEYFCPVCRTLVYPSEAMQSQCTHLYCKQCLLHVANGTKVCPYDGYLVTEFDSKPLVESDKELAENIGKVKVHCLFFRSGCVWEGAMSECDAHSSVCSFGNYPVMCNICGVQIVHRQVKEHAQYCPDVYEAQHDVNTTLWYDAAPKLNVDGLGPHSRFLPHLVGHSRADGFGPRPEFGQHHMQHFGPRSPDREYLGPRALMAEFGSSSFHGMMNIFSGQGPPNVAHFAGGIDSFDLLRERRSISAWWCRLCQIDCETDEGLDIHSQTKEHQKIAMDIVKTIKQRNMDQHRMSGAHILHYGESSRKFGPPHGNLP